MKDYSKIMTAFSSIGTSTLRNYLRKTTDFHSKINNIYRDPEEEILHREILYVGRFKVQSCKTTYVNVY